MKTISIAGVLGSNLIARPLAHDLLDYIRNSECLDVMLDFSGVEFMTRSFADEFYNLFLSGRTADVSVRIENLPDDQRALIDAVKRTQNAGIVRRRDIRVFEPKDFDAMDSCFASLSV